MPDTTLAPLEPPEFDRYAGWFHEEADDMLLGTPGSLASMFSGGSQPLAWKVQRAGQTVALVVIDVDVSQSGHLSLVVGPEFRRQGVGSAAVQLVLAEPDVQRLSSVLATVEQSNTGAQKILIKNGFARTGYSPEGHLEFRL